jgi:VCBS repeat-containing protein
MAELNGTIDDDFLNGTSEADAVAGGADDDFSFIADGAFTGNAGELILVESNGEWLLQGDTDGDRIADLVIGIQTTGGYVVKAGDFLL